MRKTRSIIYLILILLFPVLIHAQVVDKKSIIKKGAKVEKLGDGYSFTEGPAVDPSGNVFFTDQPDNKIIRWDASNGKLSVFSDNSGRSNGLYFDRTGKLIACADMNNQLWSFDITGNHTILIDNYKGKLLNGPNDLWIDPKGGIYFTDPLYKRNYWERDMEMQQDGEHVYYLTPNRLQLIQVDNKLQKPNGIIGTPDGKKLYIADIAAGKTYVYDVDDEGYLINKTLFVEMGSDGMTIDNKGNIYLTGKGVTVFNKKGEQIAHIPVDAKWTSNVCFGGEDRKLLFITAMDAVYGLKMNVRAARYK